MQGQSIQLRDIHLPEAVGWWPPAIGWWLLIVLLPLLIFLFYWLFKRITRKTAVKTAKKLLKDLKHQSIDDQDKLQALSKILRRLAMSQASRDQAASLSGQQWLEYLDRSLKEPAFSQGVGQVLASGHYQRPESMDCNMDEVFKLCETWIQLQK